MLRRLEPNLSYRSLSKGFWPKDLPLGSRSVIYGHNGSGKSSFASLLLEMASDGSPTEVLWEDEAGQRRTVGVGQAGPSTSMAVFTKEWVRRNLSQFLDGATASPIVTLGEDAIEAKEQEEELTQQIEDLHIEEKEANKKRLDHAGKARKLATAAQTALVDQLREFDYQRFTKNRFSLPVVEGKLREYRGAFPDENEHAEALKRLGEGTPKRVTPVLELPKVPAALDNLGALLSETPARVALDSLAADQQRQSWVERGLQLHEDSDECLFCAGPLTEERREQLAKHFDQSWFQIRERTQVLLHEVQSASSTLSAWLSSTPDPKDLSSGLRDVYAAHLQSAGDDVAKRLTVLEDIEKALRAKADDPSTRPQEPDLMLLKENFSTAPLQQVVEEHNKQANEHAALTEARYETVLNHIFGSRSAAFRSHEEQAHNAEAEARSAGNQADQKQRDLVAVRQKQFSNSKMAETLTKDLARVYGKNHLSITVTDDGKSYACRRGNAPATHLSDGERTTLSLLYFLRKLEDQTVSNDKSSRIVVIDDPSSSLDREAIFATHQWLVDTLKGFGQFIVLTHDFSLLRLFLKSQKNVWDNSRKKIRTGDADEKRFPKAAFLEMYAANEDGVRHTKVAALPSMLSNHTTEYAYLFSKVMEGMAEDVDHDRLFLLPNAARRVLEVFTSYKVPHLANLDQRLNALMGDDASNPYRDVYDFCNRYSHGEGSESLEVLDRRVVYGQVRRCMEFLKQADPEHFERMCKATSVDPAAIE